MEQDHENFDFARKMGVPKELINFWMSHNVSPSLISVEDEPCRYFRLTPVASSSNDPKELDSLEKKLQKDFKNLKKVHWLPSFYQIDINQGISSSELYGNGSICGMDITSACVVYKGMSIEKGNHVLDLCCAPGVKLLLMAELAGEEGSVTGHDINEHRLNVTRNLLRKYKAKSVRLFHSNSGVEFKVLAPPNEGDIEEPVPPRPKYAPKRRKKLEGNKVVDWEDAAVARYYEDEQYCRPSMKAGKRHRFDLPGLIWSDDFTLRMNSFGLYDRVLVDSECTTNGAIRHHIARSMSEASIRKEEEARGFIRTYRTNEELQHTVNLQKNLLDKGWHFLKPGGILVYCTCSLLKEENENVVESILDRYPNAVLEDFEGEIGIPFQRSKSLPKTIYFKGANCLYAARIRKPAE